MATVLFSFAVLVTWHVGHSSLVCPPSAPSGAVAWRANHTWEVLLSNSVVVCASGDLCPNGTTSANQTMPQLRPLITQTGDIITFLVDHDRLSENSSQSITLYQVSESQFLSCDSTGARVISQGFSSFTIFTEDFFQIGNNYIIGETDDESLQCQTGLRINITVRLYSCSKQGVEAIIPCGGRGLCLATSHQLQYTCKCCDGYIGPYCEEKDGCYGNPCKNGGFCIDIAEGPEGDIFQCLCPYGYSGRTCEQVTQVCDNHPCRNNGTCVGNQTSYQCICPPGFAGANCDININECASSPCVHGICLDKEDGYLCYCRPGFGGPNCEYEYNECDSNPCVNGGACEDKVGSYICHCGPGYAGQRCQIKIDLCESKPCPEERRCVDHGNNFSCECKPGFTGAACNVRYNACEPNRCQNGGTCWNSINTFFCACRPGFSGVRCQTIDFGHFYVDPLPTIPSDGQMDLSLPVSIHLDHLHNIYIAAGTLACAFLIVVIVVTVCHCRVHRTYQRFTFKMPSSCYDVTECKRYRDYGNQDSDNHVKFSMEIEGNVSGQTDSLFEASGPDFGDSLEAPLINASTSQMNEKLNSLKL
uniref:EGF-like domain-containing protein n=1 Tax=Strigamia maritima TaxID=126957 RepID=T1INC1_STRMM